MNWREHIVVHAQNNEPVWQLLVRRGLCILPEHLMLVTEPETPLILQMGFGLLRPPDPTFQEDGTEVVLSFNMAPFKCWIPWGAVVAVVVDSVAIVFQPGPNRQGGEPEAPEPKKPSLKLVE